MLLAERRRAVHVPVVWTLVRSAVRVFPHGYENRLCVGVGIADSGVVNLPAAEPLARCDNSAVVPMQVSVVLPLPLPLAEYTHAAPVPAVWASVCSAARVFPRGCEDLPCVGAGIADSGAAHFPVSAQLGQDIPAAILV